MIIELIFVLLITVICLCNNKWWCLYLIVLLYPFHAFIKYTLPYFNVGSGNIFSYWKEICIVVFVLKVYLGKQKSSKLLNVQLFSFFLIAYMSFFFLFTKAEFSDAFTKLRDMVFPILLFDAILHTDINKVQVQKIVLLFTCSVLIVCLIGFFAMFTNLRLIIAQITGKFLGYGQDGTVYYASAMMIMGLNRMTSILDSPNQLGLLCSLYLSISIYTYYYLNYNKIEKSFVIVSVVLIFLSLILTFSRTGYAIFLISAWGLIRRQKKILLHMMPLIIVVAIVVYIAIPQFSYIMGNTFNGNEASSADRSNNIIDGVSYIVRHPYGQGLGTTSFVRKNGINVENIYRAESSFVNITIEIGIFGLFLVLNLYRLIYKNMKRYRKQNFVALNMPYIVIASLVASCVSLNPYMPIYSYFFWMFMGFSFSKSLNNRSCKHDK